MLLSNPPAKVDPDIGWLLPQNRVERQEEHTEANVDACRGQKRADFHRFLSRAWRTTHLMPSELEHDP
uniref:Uncharacterized protein n=1 Tax=Arundo donax TaxID=35708 RepID=A0A0A8ZJT3_ARUDO